MILGLLFKFAKPATTAVSRRLARGKEAFHVWKSRQLRASVAVLIVRRRRLRPAAFTSRAGHYASRYPQSLRQLARPHRHGRGVGALAVQLRGLGHQRYFPRLWPLDAGQDRSYRNRYRPVPPAPTTNRMQQIQRQLGRPLPPEQAKAHRSRSASAGRHDR